jgi:hypothetical protein
MPDLSPTPKENTDLEHLKLLSTFHYVVAGLAALFACFPLIHLAMGLFIVIAPQQLGAPGNQPPAFLGWFFVAMATFFIVLGWTFTIIVLIRQSVKDLFTPKPLW